MGSPAKALLQRAGPNKQTQDEALDLIDQENRKTPRFNVITDHPSVIVVFPNITHVLYHRDISKNHIGIT